MLGRFQGRKIRLSILCGVFYAANTLALDEPASINDKVRILEQELSSLKQEVAAFQHSDDLGSGSTPQSLFLLSGYMDVNYQDTEHTNSRFKFGHFNPIFQYLYDDLVLAEAELEFEVDNHGETETKLEFATIDLFLHDYVIVVAGKFLSPLGYFVQNIHPRWINKLPSKPSGFSGGQAAPEAEIGLQLRGGFPLWQWHVNYSVYTGNGPKAEVVNGVIEKVETDGFNDALDGTKIVGARLGLLPLAKLEVGLSGATSKVGLFDGNNTKIEGGRDYHVIGADLAYQWQDLDFRVEYIRQEGGSRAGSAIPKGAKWQAWYAQAAYRFSPTKWEPVVRVSKYTSSNPEQEQKQWALGVNYWFVPSFVLKVAYEFNDGETNTANDANRFLTMLAYGF